MREVRKVKEKKQRRRGEHSGSYMISNESLPNYSIIFVNNNLRICIYIA
jgi:hypothetical protein